MRLFFQRTARRNEALLPFGRRGSRGVAEKGSVPRCIFLKLSEQRAHVLVQSARGAVLRLRKRVFQTFAQLPVGGFQFIEDLPLPGGLRGFQGRGHLLLNFSGFAIERHALSANGSFVLLAGFLKRARRGFHSRSNLRFRLPRMNLQPGRSFLRLLASGLKGVRGCVKLLCLLAALRQSFPQELFREIAR